MDSSPFLIPRHDPQPTRWSLVKMAAGTGEGAHKALGEILRHYWYPLYAFARRRGMSEPDAADGVQGFLTKVCASNLLALAREERGRLRSWMLKCFQRFLGDQQDFREAARRGGGAVHLTIDWQGAESIYLSEPALTESPEALYARAWSVSLMEEALQELADYYQKSGRATLHLALLPALESPLRDTTYAAAAAELGMTAAALRTAAVRFRNRYRAILLDLAAERLGITSEAALARELRSFLTGGTRS